MPHQEPKLPWTETPCIPNPHLSRMAGCNIYLKLENLQPSGSFKSRGIGNFMLKAYEKQQNVHFYMASGGNAGLACAMSAMALGRPATIVIPTIVPELVKGKLLDLGVEVHQVGRNWYESNNYVQDVLLAKDPTGLIIPPFDHQDVWDGAATMVDEIKQQLGENTPLHGIVCSVGGGGLINGIMQGTETHSWPGNSTPSVLAVETKGADSLNASILAGEHIQLPEMTSIALSLGATRVSHRTWEWSQDPSKRLKSLVVSDADAAISCVHFANDARYLVEAACGATLSAVYGGHLREYLGEGVSDEEWKGKNVVLVVCGGSIVTLDILQAYRAKYSIESSIVI